MLAAIPSVILGFWGILVLGPFLQAHVEPWLHATLGFIPIFGPPADDRRQHLHGRPDPHDHGRADHRLDQPRPVPDRPARAAGRRRARSARRAGRWCAASCCRRRPPGSRPPRCLGLGRALGEAIAVTQVIGAGTAVHIIAVRHRRHAREPDREPVPERGIETAHLVAVLPRACILLVIGAAHEPARAVDRAPLRRPPGLVRSDEPSRLDPTTPLTASRQPAPATGRQPARRGRGDTPRRCSPSPCWGSSSTPSRARRRPRSASTSSRRRRRVRRARAAGSRRRSSARRVIVGARRRRSRCRSASSSRST